MKNKILIILGDPESINSEIIFKSWKKLPKKIKKKIYVIADIDLLKSQFKRLNYRINLKQVYNLEKNVKTDNLKIININLPHKNSFKFSTKNLKKFITQSFDLAHKISLKNKTVAGIINCPLRKNLLNKNGLGVTEYLASKCKIQDNSEVMLIRNKNLSVSPLTTHIRLKDVPKKINRDLIIKKIKTINKSFKSIFLIKPKIGILGLNPHNAELKKESEEIKIINPAIKKLKKLKLNILGPLSADTIFINKYKEFDVIVGMYHDQVLTAFKSLYKFNAINITLGLKYLRVSPDHGVASDLIGKNKANPESLIECIKFLDKVK